MREDRINAAFEAGGAILLWINVWVLWRDWSIAGVHWLPVLWFALWGLWNLHYYRTLGQRRSWLAGIGVVAANTVWLILAGLVLVSPAQAAEECPDSYTATVKRVIDGDTVDLTVSRCLSEFGGITVSQVQRYRLAGIDTPELHGKTKAAGVAATEFLKQWLARCKQPLTLKLATRATEKYGRRLASIECAGEDASAALLEAGHARPYDGGKR